MELELEERGNIHTDTVWFEIIDSQAPPSDEGNTIATMEGLTEKYSHLGLLFTAAPDLLIACQKQQRALDRLLVICSPKTIGVHFPTRLINNARACAAKAIAKANGET
jgi:hypothetical protein